MIVTAIRDQYADAAILGEEGGVYAGSAAERFIVDPLDGTTNYAHRYPAFCVSIAFEQEGVVQAGVVHAPAFGMTFAASRGHGATCNGSSIAVSSVDRVAEALVCTGFLPWDYDRNGRAFAAFARVAQGVRRDGAAALDLALVAAGSFDAFWEQDLRPWDMAAGALIVMEAGGMVTATDGSAFSSDQPSILASNARLHAEMLKRLREA